MSYRLSQVKSIMDNCKWNLYAFSLTLFQKRKRNIWLFGAWMGEKFADNSRFLFQYISENGEKYGIKEAIWASRSKELVHNLQKMGYHAVLIGTPESNKAHLEAGVHIICNSDGNNGSKGDIDTRLSLGAKKIQLWHGVGIKASGCLKNGRPKNPIKRFLHDQIITPLCTPGGWSHCLFLTTSAESERVIHEDNNIPYSHIFRGPYPRLCECPKLLNDERDTIEQILTIKNKNGKVVLYLPTFRSSNAGYITPYETENFYEFLKDNNIWWIEKKHSADAFSKQTGKFENVISLDKEFDINVLYRYIDLLVTDYSSAASDAMFFEKPTLEYCPDYSSYQSSDRGFVAPFGAYHVSQPVTDSNKLQEEILNRMSSPDKDKILKIREFLFGVGPFDYETLMKSLLSKMEENK